MVDFLNKPIKYLKKSKSSYYGAYYEVEPDFHVMKSSDLMIRGHDFYAIWIEEEGKWSTDEQAARDLVDRELDIYVKEHPEEYDGLPVRVKHLSDGRTKMVNEWINYCRVQMVDNYHTLDQTLIFSNTPTSKKNYSSKSLPYPLKKGTHDAWDQMMSVLYSPEELEKLEWAVGSIVSGASKTNQKFVVLYGPPKSGKSTFLRIVEEMFKGYCCTFDAKSLGKSGGSSSDFAMEAFKDDALIGVQHDGDLSRIEDNTRLNSIVSHEKVIVNTKNKSMYSSSFNTFLFMGTNKPVKITDAKSGIIRRLIDVTPTGDKIPKKKYDELMEQIKFEYGAITQHCKEVYKSDPTKYDNYIPVSMLSASNDFYNFIDDSFFEFKNDNGVSGKVAWEKYKAYCDASNTQMLSMRVFKEELKNYFEEVRERYTLEDGTRVRNYYLGFKTDKFEQEPENEKQKIPSEEKSWIDFKEQPSLLDEMLKDCPAQYATQSGTPQKKWAEIKTTLADLDTTKVHYLKPPLSHVVIDFDIPDEEGNKSLERNIKEASKWKKTYAELSKSGQGIHLHYLYSGDPNMLSSVAGDHVEIKVFKGNASLRRRLSMCNDIPVAEIDSGLPLKGEAPLKMFNKDAAYLDKDLYGKILRTIRKEYENIPSTVSGIQFISKLLDEAYKSGKPYDVSELKWRVLSFGANSTHHAEYCIKEVNKMHFCSENPSEYVKNQESADFVIFDVEVYPNFFGAAWKKYKDPHVIKWFNPTPEQIAQLGEYRLGGFNNLRYDNAICYARMIGASNKELYDMSKRITSGDKNVIPSESRNFSWIDIYDMASKKQSLKKWEIELAKKNLPIKHEEIDLQWDQPVPEELWPKIMEYCANDVVATEAVWEECQPDFTAREILADIADLPVNSTTNTLTTRIIFRGDKNPQSQFNYRNMADGENLEMLFDDEFTLFDEFGRPVFKGYTFDRGKSTYRGEEVGEGGYVYAEPGMYYNVAVLDIASMHPHSIKAENLFGDVYTKRFVDLLDARIAIKHKDFDKAKKLFDGKLERYLTDEDRAKELSGALKIAINSVYGLTSAKFENAFRDVRNKDNIVAKRGALFMINLKHMVQQRGFTVTHIKTDSIKIPNATPEIIQFVMDYGRAYGYEFELEDTYERMCLVNDAVYICKQGDGTWAATGTQFQVPYVFKTLFSKEPITFYDKCETKSVTTALYLDLNETLPEDEHSYRFVGRVGLFCPVKPGNGGGLLMRQSADGTKYTSVTGTKGFRWIESEMIKNLDYDNIIDISYYDKLVDKAIETIGKYGDFEQFVE